MLDELTAVLTLVRVEKTPPRAHEVLMELRDISSMAMEHFEEKILPDLKKVVITISSLIVWMERSWLI